MTHWLMHVLGFTSASGPWYLFWSGFGGNTPVWFIGGIAFGWHHNCHMPRCLRFSRHRVDVNGISKIACKRHERSAL